MRGWLWAQEGSDDSALDSAPRQKDLWNESGMKGHRVIDDDGFSEFDSKYKRSNRLLVSQDHGCFFQLRCHHFVFKDWKSIDTGCVWIIIHSFICQVISKDYHKPMLAGNARNLGLLQPLISFWPRTKDASCSCAVITLSSRIGSGLIDACCLLCLYCNCIFITKLLSSLSLSF